MQIYNDTMLLSCTDRLDGTDFRLGLTLEGLMTLVAHLQRGAMRYWSEALEELQQHLSVTMCVKHP